MSGSSTSKGDYQTDDAKQQAENIAAGEEAAPPVNVSSDYEASKEYSVSEVDKSGTGVEAARAVSSSGQATSGEETQLESESTGDPDQYRQMAKDTNANT